LDWAGEIAGTVISVTIRGCRMFRRMDDDGSKNLGYDEFRKGIDETGLELSEDGYKEMFAKFDKDGSGKLSIDEFLFSVRVSRAVEKLVFITSYSATDV
jgi:hypothetical protein